LRPFGVELIWMAANIAATNLKKKSRIIYLFIFRKGLRRDSRTAISHPLHSLKANSFLK